MANEERENTETEDKTLSESIPKIFVTDDYSVFKLMNGNRSFDHKRAIVNSVKRVGHIPSPIICNEKMEVVDGQGRLAAFKELKLPVYYIVIQGLGIEECISMNISQSNWTTLDYIMRTFDKRSCANKKQNKRKV